MPDKPHEFSPSPAVRLLLPHARWYLTGYGNPCFSLGRITFPQEHNGEAFWRLYLGPIPSPQTHEAQRFFRSDEETVRDALENVPLIMWNALGGPNGPPRSGRMQPTNDNVPIPSSDGLAALLKTKLAG